jgi:micrococcal nuclease
VVGVIDGDSARVMHEGKAEQIRLSGMHGPERKQPFGTKAKQATSTLTFGKVAEVQSSGVYRAK